MSPLKVFEYMEAGKAIIASDLPVLREVLVNMDNCILCHPSQLEAWEKSLSHLVKNEKLRLELGSRAQMHLINSYSWNRRAERVRLFMREKIISHN